MRHLRHTRLSLALSLVIGLVACRVGPVEQCHFDLESNISNDGRTLHVGVDCISDGPDLQGSYSCFCQSHDEGIFVAGDDDSEWEESSRRTTFSEDDACTVLAGLDNGEQEREARIAAALPQLEQWCDADLSSLPDDTVISNGRSSLVGAHVDLDADKR